MTTFVRSYAETRKVNRGQVYKVYSCRDNMNKLLVPQFGKMAGEVGQVELQAHEWDALIKSENLIEVQPFKRKSDDSLHFMHNALIGDSICWMNATTSGTMQGYDLFYFLPVTL